MSLRLLCPGMFLSFLGPGFTFFLCFLGSYSAWPSLRGFRVLVGFMGSCDGVLGGILLGSSCEGFILGIGGSSCEILGRILVKVGIGGLWDNNSGEIIESSGDRIGGISDGVGSVEFFISDIKG